MAHEFERCGRAKTVYETKPEDQERPVLVKKPQYPFNLCLPTGSLLQEGLAFHPSNKEIELVFRQAPHQGGQHDPLQL